MLREISLPQIFSTPQQRLVRASGIRSQASLSRKAAVVVLIVLNTALLFAYILGVNNYASTGYKIKALQNEIGRINQENKKLNLSVSEGASVSNLETQLTQSGFTVVKGAKFLQQANQFSQK